jgi:hypothetical protein
MAAQLFETVKTYLYEILREFAPERIASDDANLIQLTLM